MKLKKQRRAFELHLKARSRFSAFSHFPEMQTRESFPVREKRKRKKDFPRKIRLNRVVENC